MWRAPLHLISDQYDRCISKLFSRPSQYLLTSPTRLCYSDNDWDKKDECWICYDNERTDAGPVIQPCNCKGDVGAVHHECLKRWLIEVSHLYFIHILLLLLCTYIQNWISI